MTDREVAESILEDNLHGIDIDPCCSKMAAFSLAFVAWTTRDDKTRETLGYRPLPPLNVACSGQALDQEQKKEWLKFANGDAELRSQIDDLFTTFKDCYHVGSLIDPVREYGSLFCTHSAEITRKLTKQLAKYQHDAEAAAIGVAAQGLAKAAELLSGRYTLVATNVPYLGRGKQADVIKNYLDEHYPLGKADLATAFVLRCLDLCAAGGSTALVTPQNWLFLTSYKKLREELLKRRQWNLVARLGPRAFETITGEVVNVALLTISAVKPADDHRMAGLDVAEARTPTEKADRMADHVPTPVQVVEQAGQLKNPDAKIAFGDVESLPLLVDYASAPRGIVTGDRDFWVRQFWELPSVTQNWRFLHGPVEQTADFDGRDSVINWATKGKGMLRPGLGNTSYGKKGVAVSQIGDLPSTIYTGELYDNASFAIVPFDKDNLPAVWAFCSSEEYVTCVRHFDQKLSVDPSHLVKVPFDLAHWQAVAAEKYPNGLPEPHSDDPTQWLFRGDIATSTDPLQVAVARLLGYRWPDQPKEDAVVDPFVDDDGIVCLPGVKSEPPAAERLADLLRAVGYKTEVDLAAWLRDTFFVEHCKRFHQRP
ncbi:MAG: BREX-1 system adenine-specific DNA-methyltransferase PglX, partial [Cryobacterium sp.]|nr:BREX-1 system adenine-specific DNA-methyltransferase PglX [Cryobacterium sp.]